MIWSKDHGCLAGYADFRALKNHLDGRANVGGPNDYRFCCGFK